MIYENDSWKKDLIKNKWGYFYKEKKEGLWAEHLFLKS